MGRRATSGEQSPDALAAAQQVAAAPKAASAGQVPARVVLAKNCGFLSHGRSHWYAAGTSFDPSTQGELISRLVRAGAVFH